MKYVKISKNETLSSLTEKVGVSIVDQILADNGLDRTPNIGKQWDDKCKDAKNSPVSIQPIQKVNILNQFVSNSDIYEKAVLQTESDWKVLAQINSFPNYLYVSDQLEDSIVDSSDIIGNKESVPTGIYQSINDSILKGKEIDSSIFGSYSTMQHVGLVEGSESNYSSSSPLGWFKIPQNEVLLYSSMDGVAMSIPAYPEEMSDERRANYTTMPDLIYQYEPWQLYQSSGPRSNSYTFHLHRDMWTGDHSDGKANELIRFCQAQCYPRYNGAAVNTPTVTLYVSGSNLITGVLTSARTEFSGPIGKDGFYLEFKLILEITEVSKEALSYDSILKKPLIG